MSKSIPARPGLYNPRPNPPYGRTHGVGLDVRLNLRGDTTGPLGYCDLGTPDRGRTSSADLNQPANRTLHRLVAASIASDAAGGVTVWAFRVGAWSKAPGWGYVINFRSLSDLITEMEARGLQGKVSQLGIVTHGDMPGRIQLDRDLTAATIPQFDAELAALSRYLRPNAWVIFFACIAGKAKEGTELLTSISKQLRGRTIVGFELYGFFGIGTNAAGMVKASETPFASIAVDPRQNATYGYLNPWCPFAKRAKDGQLVHRPVLEQNNRPGFTCANPACPDHSAPNHSCVGW